MAQLQSRPVKFGMALIVLLWLFQTASAQNTCSKCDSNNLLPDCKADGTAPADGGPACFCVLLAPLPGCVLKPCENVTTGEIFCEFTKKNGESSDRMFGYSFRCTPGEDQCESCSGLIPKDCTIASFINPPAAGGPPCSCGGKEALSPAGCTLKPCMTNGDLISDLCICQPKIKSTRCFRSKCPGNSSGGKSGSEATHPRAGMLAGLLLVITSWSSFGGLIK